jgi:integrase
MAMVTKREGTRGASWRVSWREGGGRSGPRQSRTFPTASAARQFAADVEAAGERLPLSPLDPNAADNPDAVLHVLSFDDWAARWLASRTGITPRTRTDYKSGINKHLSPVFGRSNVLDPRKINQAAISTWVNDLEASGMAPKTIRNIHGLMHNIMQGLVEWEPEPLRKTNPCARTRLPRRDAWTDEGEEKVYLEQDEFNLIYDAARPDSKALLLFLVSTGCRWGEATALQVSDCQLTREPYTVTIRRAWQRTEDYRHKVAPPKTRAGRRTIQIPGSLADLLADLCAGQPKQQWVFRAPKGIKPWRHDHFYPQRWKPALEAAQAEGLTKSPRIHDLRHTHAAWLISAGVPLPVIQARLGHESIRTTVDVYGALTQDVREAAVAAVEMHTASILGARRELPAIQ